MKRRITTFAVLPMILAACVVRADVKPAKVFSDHMVLQQELPIAVWGAADADEEVTVTLAGRSATAKTGDDGRWLVKLPVMKADGKQHTLTIKGKNTVEFKDVLLGEVWLTSGQSNMGRSIQLKEPIPGVRIFYRNQTIPGTAPCEYDYGDGIKAGWCDCSADALAATGKTLFRGSKLVTPNSYGEVAVRFAEKLHKELGVPVGVMNIAWGGSNAATWTPKPGLEKEHPFGKPIEARGFKHIPGVMYQTQLHPIVPLTIRGVVWYQGEDDGRNQKYDQDLKALIESWRTLFQQKDLPFYMIQIAQTGYASGMLRVWECEAWVHENVAHTGLVPSNDLQDKTLRTDDKSTQWVPASGFPLAGGSNPHPPNKHVVAQRAADVALAKTYGKLDREVFGPMYDSHTAADGKVTIKFKHVGDGLKTDDGKAPNWFQVAPPLTKKLYHPSEKHYSGRLRTLMKSAKAEIVGKDTVVVHLPDDMKEAFWVSFAWHALSRHNLRNSENLSAIPFRIWKGVPPQPKK